MIHLSKNLKLEVYLNEYGIYGIHKIGMDGVRIDNFSYTVYKDCKSKYFIFSSDGNVLMQFHGHNSEIYCMKWFEGSGSPFCDNVERSQSSSSQNATSLADGEDPKGRKERSYCIYS